MKYGGKHKENCGNLETQKNSAEHLKMTFLSHEKLENLKTSVDNWKLFF